VAKNFDQLCQAFGWAAQLMEMYCENLGLEATKDGWANLIEPGTAT
jgi:hypothetical protein